MNGLTQVIVAATGLIVAINATLAILTKKQANRVEATTTATAHQVNQSATDLGNYNTALVGALNSAGVAVPQDQSKPGVAPAPAPGVSS